jgi:hypothetical protein
MGKKMGRPVFIVGTGRCGSTLFHEIFCQSQAFYWLTQKIEKRPGQPEVNARIMMAMTNPLLKIFFKRGIWPSEAYLFWEHFCPGFARPFRDITEMDVTPRVAKVMRANIPRAFPDDRKRPLFKITGWPRIGFIREVWPDAQFINVVRDGRAVTNSVIAAPYFDGWSGPNNWCRGYLSQEQEALWKKHGHSFVSLAAFGWDNRMNAFREAIKGLDESNYHEIKYEDLCENPAGICKASFEFLGLDWGKSQEAFIGTFNIRNTNDKYLRDLNQQQIDALEECLGESLAHWGYA